MNTQRELLEEVIFKHLSVLFVMHATSISGKVRIENEVFTWHIDRTGSDDNITK